MSWRVRSDDIILDFSRMFGSKMGLQKLNFEVSQYCARIFVCQMTQYNITENINFSLSRSEFIFATAWHEFGSRFNCQQYIIAANSSIYNNWNV